MMTGQGTRDTVALAGWLFADLLLGLGLLFFVAESKGTPPAPTPTITPTPSRTFTATSTITRMPTYTRYPTFTPIYTFTPYPTYTPLPPNLTYTPYPTFTEVPPEFTYTPYPTFTEVPPEFTYTPYPTYTPFPPLPTSTPAATVLFGLNGTPYTANFRIDPGSANTLVSGSSEARSAARAEIQSRLAPQVQRCFGQFDGVARAGVALIFGTNPNPTTGNVMAQETDTVLRQEFPRIFDGTVSKNYHFISSSPSDNGAITVEIYFINASGSGEPFNPEENTCNP